MRDVARLFGRMGGEARAKKLTAQQRSDIARKASLARWKGHAQPKVVKT